MNALTSLFSSHLPRPMIRGTVTPLLARPARRDREFGTGYGSSSGYASAARYVPKTGTPHFRFG